ncbi:MAG: hypothetical protein SGI74_06195 [Oligoflexia bacterium]|nr:hypothetical protein [Oligoflexia bacterium]
MTQKLTPKSVPIYGGKPIPYSLKPVILTKEASLFIETSLTEILKQVEDFTTQALKDKKTLVQLGLPGDLDPRPTPLGLHIPFARFDFLFDGTNLNIIELNTDGTSGYNTTEWVAEAAGLKPEENPNHGLSDKLLDALLEHKPQAKEVVLADFPHLNTSWEQDDLIERWKQRISCHRADPKLKSWKNNAIIYRRVLSWQLRSQPARAKAMLDDWKAQNVTTLGGWSSDVGMSKAWPSFVKPKHCPETQIIDMNLVKKMQNEKEKWVLKGALSFSGQSVIRGIDLPDDRWKNCLLQVLAETEAKRPWIAQQRINLPLYEDKPTEYGMFFLNGKPSGYMCRWGHSEVLSDTSTEVFRAVKIV